MDREQQVVLARKAVEEDDPAAWEAIFSKFKTTVEIKSKRYGAHNAETRRDLLGEGYLGITIAVKDWVRKGMPGYLSTFVERRVAFSMLDYLRDFCDPRLVFTEGPDPHIIDPAAEKDIPLKLDVEEALMWIPSRWVEMLRLHSEGFGYAEIGRKYFITKSRARQIVEQARFRFEREWRR